MGLMPQLVTHELKDKDDFENATQETSSRYIIVMEMSFLFNRI
jgi:hypothetical protein